MMNNDNYHHHHHLNGGYKVNKQKPMMRIEFFFVKIQFFFEITEIPHRNHIIIIYFVEKELWKLDILKLCNEYIHKYRID